MSTGRSHTVDKLGRFTPKSIVEPGVDDQCLQGRLRVALGLGNTHEERLEQLGHALPRLGADPQGIRGIDTDDVLDLLGHLVRIGRGQVDLVDDR